MFIHIALESDGGLEEGIAHLDELTGRVELLAHGGRMTVVAEMRSIDLREEDFDVRLLDFGWANAARVVELMSMEGVMTW